MATIDMDLDRIAAALSGKYAGRPDLDALRGELRRLLDRAETGEQHGRITALEKLLESLEARKTERRAIARRLTDQAESAARIRELEAALERRRPRGATWKTRDGRVLPIAAMDTDHIRNALAMLRRKGYCSVAEFESSWASIGMLQGDMATYYAEQSLDGMRPYRAIDCFEEELERRGEKP